MLARVHRLRKSRDVQKVLHKGTRIHANSLKLSYIQNRVKKPRFTVIVSTKTAKLSTMRNRLKRQIRAVLLSFTQETPLMPLDIVITVTRLPQNGQLVADQCRDLLSRIADQWSAK